MASLLTTKRFTFRHIPISFGHRHRSTAGPCWPNAVFSHVSQARPYLRVKTQTGIGLPAVTVPLVAQTYTQRRYDSSKHGAARRRWRQEEAYNKNKRAEPSTHANTQQDVNRDRKSDRKKKEDKEAKGDPRKEAVEENQGLKTFRPARLPIVLCHGMETPSRF
jgi:hypothetical protein